MRVQNANDSCFVHNQSSIQLIIDRSEEIYCECWLALFVVSLRVKGFRLRI
jgi:hypothetical protein